MLPGSSTGCSRRSPAGSAPRRRELELGRDRGAAAGVGAARGDRSRARRRRDRRRRGRRARPGGGADRGRGRQRRGGGRPGGGRERREPLSVGGYPDDLRRLVEDHLGRLTYSRRDATAGLEEAMRYSLLAGGKRIRPVLCLATGRAVGIDPPELLDISSALELIHTYSLIHDDLPAMDDDELRRGRPTSHVAHGEDVAILAGDALFAEAVRLACVQPGRPERVLAAVREITAATGVDGMVGGQYIDVTGEERDPEALRRLHSLKTGRLIAACVGAALAIAGLSPERQAPYRRFATELGLLFQIVDDILDVTGSEEELG
ncbi:MAG: polyprenyl synthetase family protein, partial [Thermoleophilia bacterium]|nr:polyprenyl synthetase family protein [Thermoleophilia bacterium]